MSVPSRRQNAWGVLALASELCETLKPLLVPNVRLSQAIQPKTVVERKASYFQPLASVGTGPLR
jgi:hypothetical protein